MGLNKSVGNMYDFVTHTWNTIKGQCYHDCTYCYMKRWGKLNPVRFDKKELKTDLGKDNFIFVGSSCDMFTVDVDWIQDTLFHCRQFENKYLFQSKNTFGFKNEWLNFPKESVFCTTIETNRWYHDIMVNCPKPHDRAFYLPQKSYITIEPIMDFDLLEMLQLIKISNPIQVNIGSDSGNNKLPEPSKDKLMQLIEGLKEFTTIAKKRNLERLLK